MGKKRSKGKLKTKREDAENIKRIKEVYEERRAR